MDRDNSLRIYLDRATLIRARSGNHNFLNKLMRASRGVGLDPRYRLWSETAALRETDAPGRSLMHMKPPVGPRSLSFRAAYVLPFWRIEASDKRWEWQVARLDFPDPDPAKAKAARAFCDLWRGRLFAGAASGPTPEGPALVALQGRLTEKRSFQSASPLVMLEAVLEHLPGKQVLACLHPKESCSTAEIAALQALAARHSRLSIHEGGAMAHLPGAAMVVTENSSVAFLGYFLHKPAVLFADIDFHHIAANAASLGPAEAFRQAAERQPDYDAYLHWNLAVTAINAGRPDAEARIVEALRTGGWQV